MLIHFINRDMLMNMLLDRYQLDKNIEMCILDDKVINRTKIIFLNYQKENYIFCTI